MAFFRKKQRLVGIDLGRDSIKLVELKMTNLGYQITNFAKLALPRDMESGQAIDDSLSLINTIRRAVWNMGASNLKAAVAIKEHLAYIDYLTMPQLPKKELAKAINFQLANLLTFPIEKAQIDFGKVGETSEEGITRQEVMVVAVKKEIVEEKIDLFRNAGVNPVVMDIEALAVQRMLKEIVKIDGSLGSYAIINMGFGSTSVSVFCDDKLKFTQNLSFGGDMLTKSLCEFFKISYVEGEKIKKLISLTGEFQEHGVNILLHQKAEVMEPVLESMIKEIKQCLINMEISEETQTECYLIGGCAMFKGLDEILSQELMLKVQLINPASFLSLSPHLESQEKEIYQAGPTFAVALGLALSEV